jgi:hypothetical protein
LQPLYDLIEKEKDKAMMFEYYKNNK